jgi:nucleoside-diphosphate-sugar epimerase
VGVVRSEEQFEGVRTRGGEPRFGNLEGTFAPALEGSDAVVFTAGSGGGTGWEKTLMVDLWGAKRAVEACEAMGIGRFVMVSSRGAGDPQAGREPLRPYLVAKHFADEHLRQSALDATILRPTRLTDEDGTGRVASFFGDETGEGDPIPRADVAHAIVVCLNEEATTGCVLSLYGGDTPIETAVRPAG